MFREKRELHFYLTTLPIPEKVLDRIESELSLHVPVGEDSVIPNIIVTVVPQDVFVSTLHARQAQLDAKTRKFIDSVEERLFQSGRRKRVKKVD